MVDGVKSGSGGIGRNALEAAIKRMQERSEALKGESTGAVDGGEFASAIKESIAQVDEKVRATENLHLDALKGDLDFHEVAARVKQSELTFDFAMQIRNKLIDAYREVMRMGV